MSSKFEWVGCYLADDLSWNYHWIMGFDLWVVCCRGGRENDDICFQDRATPFYPIHNQSCQIKSAIQESYSICHAKSLSRPMVRRPAQSADHPPPAPPPDLRRQQAPTRTQDPQRAGPRTVRSAPVCGIPAAGWAVICITQLSLCFVLSILVRIC